MAQQATATTVSTTWRSIYPVHPCAEVFPLMDKDDLELLAVDIKSHGLQQPVVLWEDPKVSTKPVTYFVLDGRNRLDALTRLGVVLPSPDDPREMVELPGSKQLVCVFEVANHPKQWTATQVHDPAAFVIGANIQRRHLTKEERAALILKTIEAGRVMNDRATVARSFSPTPGTKGGSTKDPVLAKAVEEAQKHGISKRVVQNARAKLQGKQPAPRKTVRLDQHAGQNSPPTPTDRQIETNHAGQNSPPSDLLNDALPESTTVEDLERLMAARDDMEHRRAFRAAHPEPAQVFSQPPPSNEATPLVAPKPTTTSDQMAVHYSSATSEHGTPPEILKAVIACLGTIDLDPCSNADGKPHVPAKQHFTKTDNGLTKTWSGRVFMNPPYGREIDPWVQKLVTEYKAGRVTAAIALVPGRIDTEWFSRFRDFPFCAVRGRLTFVGNEDSAPFPSVLVYLGKHRPKFYRTFAKSGDMWIRVDSKA